MKTIHPAVDQHAMEENERLRGLLREIAEGCTRRDMPSEQTVTKWADRIDAALSQQAEPTDTFTATDMATAAAQGFRDGQAATVKDCLTVQSMAYAVFAANGNAVCFSTRRDHPSLVALEKEGHSVVSLAPIAQTAPQAPERLPVEPYQTVDRRSTNYKAGWNACRKAMFEGQAAPQPEQSGLRAIHAMILNALDRDAAEGKAARGEMAAELRAAMTAKGRP